MSNSNKEKSKTYFEILKCANKEFLANGFDKASMRKIAKQLNISATALYRHFEDKEAIFEELVAPFLNKFTLLYKEAMTDTFNDSEVREFWVTSLENVKIFIDLVFDEYDAACLLLSRSRGTKYERFVYELIDMEVEETLRLITELKSRKITVNNVGREELHLLMSAYLIPIFDVISKGKTKEEVTQHADNLLKFFYPGWSAILGF